MSTYTQGPINIALQWCKIKEHKGIKILSNSMYASLILINLDAPELQEFHENMQPDDLISPVNCSSSKPVKTTSPIDDAFFGRNSTTISELLVAADESVHCVVVSVVKINAKKGWYYESCMKCFKKLEPDGAIWYCNKCENTVNNHVSRFKVEVLVIDETGTAYMTLFYRDTSSFLGTTAEKLRKLCKEHISYDEKLIEKYSVDYTVPHDIPHHDVRDDSNTKVLVDIKAADDAISTPIQSNSKSVSVLEARCLSFSEVATSNDGDTPSTSKKSFDSVSNGVDDNDAHSSGYSKNDGGK
ncbi:replication protein A 70 kDa DNA-binding subunit-like isoform X1 [Senna tora]|uniref:Replication protein A 70 kDa DNA-binding subunit-like isoform X1 n=1 Tax=Senna tora TaxID=362788 RepID=A0A834T445_9FABA|nr:replication protein A 70 kDa DNA-binding subunit-like isoform X1 [Senna tora]